MLDLGVSGLVSVQVGIKYWARLLILEQDHEIENEMLFKAGVAGSLHLGPLNGECSGMKWFWFYQSSTLANIPSNYNTSSAEVFSV